MGRVTILSSLDSHFAIVETITRKMAYAEKIRICSPWVGKSFVHLMQRTIPNGAQVSLLVRIPEDNDWKTFKALEALESIGNEKGWGLDIICVPRLHAKFMVINDRNIIFGTFNATNSGLFDNFEVLIEFDDFPDITRQFVSIFNRFERHEHNLPWKLVKKFHGPTIDKKALLLTVQYLRRAPFQEAQTSYLIQRLIRNGYKFEVAKQKVIELYEAGVIMFTDNKLKVKLNPKYARIFQ